MTYLQEAFDKFKLLEEEELSLDNDGMKELKSIINDDDDEISFVDVIDPEAETEDELEDSYIGKVILDCSVCHSKIYKNAEDVTYDDVSGLANEGDECPFCYSVDGYTIVGQVAPYDETEVKVDVEPKEDEVEVEETETEFEESCGNKPRKVRNLGKRDVDESIEDIEQRSLNSLLKDIDDRSYEEADPDLEAAMEYIKDYPEPYLNPSEMSPKARKARRVKDAVNRNKEESFKEGLENLDIETEHDKIHVSAEEKQDADKEVIAPLDPAKEQDILANSEEEEEDTSIAPVEEPEDDYQDIDIDEFDETSFDTMGESYLKNVYENVDSFKTSKVQMSGNGFIVEGVIGFKSGKNKNTSFKFEAKDCKNNKVRFIGENLQISKGRKSFTLKGTVNGKAFIPESLNYNYRVNGNRVYGTAKK